MINDRSTDSFNAALGWEQLGIKHYRGLHRSDNKYHTVDPNSWRSRVAKLKALQEFGPYVPPF